MKIMWSLVTILSAYFCVSEMIDASLDYFSYVTITSFDTFSETQAPFPAITICNLNPFQTDFALEYIKMSPMATLLNNDSLDDFRKRLSLLSLLSKLNDTTKKQFAYGIEEILISCTFNTQPCTQNDFEWYFHPFYGTCYRFNNQLQPRIVTSSGYIFGLRFELVAGNEAKMPSYIQKSGYQIMIVNQTKLPTINRGFFVSPGAETFFEISRSFSSKLGRPYSECLDDRQLSDSVDSEIYKVIKIQKQEYRQVDCFALAIQKTIIENCRCYTPLLNALNSVEQCISAEQIRCALNQAPLSFEKFHKLCPLECDTQAYGTVISASLYPIQLYALKLLNNSIVSSKFSNESLTPEKVMRSVLAVNIYYKDLSYTKKTEHGRYQLIDLVSSIGGIMGLYLG